MNIVMNHNESEACVCVYLLLLHHELLDGIVILLRSSIELELLQSVWVDHKLLLVALFLPFGHAALLDKDRAPPLL